MESHHDLGYMVPINRDDEMDLLKARITRLYPDPQMQQAMLEQTSFGGTYYRVTDSNENRRLFSYQQIRKALLDYRRVCYIAADESATFLMPRDRFRGRR